MTLTLDAGALIALDRNDRVLHVAVRRAWTRNELVTVPAPVVGQAWRGGPRQSRLAVVLAGCEIEPTTDEDARAAGVLLGRAGTSDIVDALVVLSAARRGDEVLTSDPKDLEVLADVAPGTLRITAA